ncbi:MAG: VOC family protein [Actinophytocola sp.]|uniref:VOC family protein n=1 Tax=Actinophytocola sp. TaxID=1872138 RepID=UPI00132493B4|nr:VOC family protein [Actinophytocola sp.]MPZ80950.1 VOC family protein [Actinophytocola sp.]
MTHGTVGWIQVDTDDPAGAEKFYGELFDWTFAADPNGGGKYHLATGAGAEHPHGGILDTEGNSPSRATFVVIVSDVAKAVAEAERLGGKVVNPPTTTPSGLTFADLQDPAGNHFGVFTRPGA